MKSMIICGCLILVAFYSPNYAQEISEKASITRTCLDYVEGFYEGDTVKIIRSLSPTLYKFGYWKEETSTTYKSDGQMTFAQAVKYAKNVYDKKRFAKPDAPKMVVVLDVMNHIAAAKVTAWWGEDYLLLSKNQGKWMIEQVLWEGPFVENNEDNKQKNAKE